jgi:hypothetical protein
LIAEKRALGIDGTNGMIATPIEAVCTSNWSDGLVHLQWHWSRDPTSTTNANSKRIRNGNCQTRCRQRVRPQWPRPEPLPRPQRHLVDENRESGVASPRDWIERWGNRNCERRCCWWDHQW